ncbi:TonB-dependent siderophore receptor [Aeromonas crassostreae]
MIQPPRQQALCLLLAAGSSLALPAMAADPIPDETITVTGRAQSLYRVGGSSLATGTETPLDETPQSIQLLPAALIEDQAARQVTDLYRSISGVSQYSYSGVTFRGFRQDEIRYDGLRGDPFNGFAVPQLASIEEVQVLKGPAGALFGSGEPGGLINYVTKKPDAHHKNRVKVTAGNQDFAGAAIDLYGALSDDGSHSYRAGLYQDHENPSRDNTDTRNRILDLGYGWEIGDSSRLLLQFTDIQQVLGGARLRGVPTDQDGNFLADIDWNANEASDYQRLDARVYLARLNHDFNDWLSGDLALRYYENREAQAYHEPSGLSDTNGDGVADWSAREFRDQVRNNKAGTLAGNLTARLGDHTLLAGADYFRLKADYLYYRARKADGVTGISLSDPAYGTSSASDYKQSLVTDSDTLSERYGVFVQDQWAITPDWNLLAGSRLDGFRDRTSNNLNQEVESYRGSGASYRLGTTYQLSEQIKPYLLWSTGFVPQDAASQTGSVGGPFSPEESELWEAGLRTYWFDDAINLNLASYRIVKRNLLQTDPNDTDRKVAFGKVRSQGLEVDLLGDLTDNWVANLSYAYNDTRIKQSYDGLSSQVGDRFANAPAHQLGAWTRYDLPRLDSAVALGMDYVSDQLNQSGQTVKPYTVFDASWQTRWQDWELQLNLKNLFDKEYAVSGFIERTGHFPGEGRRAYLSVSREF